MEEEGMHLMKGLVVSFLELTQQLVVIIGYNGPIDGHGSYWWNNLHRMS
jgi:hypothetical protein